jgi:hypothetical protein
MRWRLEFYNERQGILAHYGIEAPLPAEAVRLGRNALLVDHPLAAARRRISLFEQAERAGGQDSTGWILYRIGKDNDQKSTLGGRDGHVPPQETEASPTVSE